jgi:UPF0755 protein
MTDINLTSQDFVKPRRFKRLLAPLLVVGVFCALFLFLMVTYTNTPPSDFVIPTVITVIPGTTVKDITENLEAASVVRSGSLLYFILALLFEPTDIKASTYAFDAPLTTYEVAQKLTTGDFSSDLIRFTHFEGERATSIAARASMVLKDFDSKRFLERAVPVEGKLFPDTYFVPADFTADQLLELMLRTYEESLAPLQDAITASSLTTDEVIILASVIEREANSEESMKMVSGILQNRLAIGMALQADASIEYVLDKPLSELTPEDLKIDSPYNTYLNTGLPPTPIGNPGLTAINAVLFPTQSDYFYYITDDEGNFYYAKTYDEHLDNIDRYLR